MIAGYFDRNGQPFVEVRVVIPSLGLSGQVHFLVDTGSDTSILHPYDAGNLNCPFDELATPAEVTGAGGTHTYYAEPAVVSLYDGEARRDFRIDLYVGKPHPVTDGLDSLLGRDVPNSLRMDYDYPDGRLEFEIR